MGMRDMAIGGISGIKGAASVSLHTTKDKAPVVYLNVGGVYFFFEPAEAEMLADDLCRALAELAQAQELAA